VSEQDATSGKIPIFAHESLVAQYAQENGLIAELQAVRSMHMFGSSLGPADRKHSNNGIGPFLGRGATGFLPPNRTFEDKLEVTVAGIPMQLLFVPSEADSEIAVYLPDDKILLSAEVVQDHTFPNLYTIRGARYRDPVRWVKSLDRLRELDSDAMVLQHGPPVVGKSEVARVLTLYRDQIQFVHDQTIRYMNKGLPPDELARAVRLPKHLAEERPWGREFYGTVKHSVRNIYNGYVGWFAGDPVDLDPTPRDKYSTRVIALMGGHDKVLAASEQALKAGDAQFSAELSSLLVHAATGDTQAQHLQAAAFRKLGYAQISANWRNYYLVSAMELDGQLPSAPYLKGASEMLGGAYKGLPASNQVAALPSRLRAEATLDQDMVVGVRYTDVKDEFRLHLRRGVLEVAHKAAVDAPLIFEVTRPAMGALLAGAALPELLQSQAVKVIGDPATATRFMGYFERPFTAKPEVVVR
jgi:alkyl sulfatase BDS1-like metallo-beta-lactamase superfamily hydrolase